MGFGPLVTGGDIRRAAVDTLQTWIVPYLAQRERETGRDPQTLEPPRSYISAFELDRWPEEQLPCILVAVTELTDRPVQYGKIYRARWRVDVTVVVGAAQGVDDLVHDYCASIRRVLSHKLTIGQAGNADWVDERYDVLGARNRRQFGAGTTSFDVEAWDALQSNAGPTTLPVDPYDPPADDPIVDETEVLVDPVEEIQNG